MKKVVPILLPAIFIVALSCKQPKQETDGRQEVVAVEHAKEVDAIFPQGQKGSPKTFTGNAYNYGLVMMDSTYTTLVGNVYFEPGARSNWHIHPAGQILIITDGEGFHQIEGQPKEILKKGSVVKCPPNTKHWHGASPDKGMQQLYIVPNTEKGVVEWMEAVTDEQYNGN
ncbi:cupin domain-containing protein [Flagellimonas amoyensis]|uniref:cupin domain-containing protein n=1 Tax=Flagellimonas amoyensis TaxID=2169401 RepID=UPI000D358FD0|nr:cupin domain-containing protein [Allomuricauda amoyensis]